MIDAALRSKDQPNAQLVAAELLCRNAHNLDACQSLHWPSLVDGGWDSHLGPKTKLLLLEALLNMTLAPSPMKTHFARSQLDFMACGPGKMIHECKDAWAPLIKSIVPQMQRLGYNDFIQGDYKIKLADLELAAKSASDNPDESLHRIVARNAELLSAWSAKCDCTDLFRGSMGGEISPVDSLEDRIRHGGFSHPPAQLSTVVTITGQSAPRLASPDVATHRGAVAEPSTMRTHLPLRALGGQRGRQGC